MDKKNKIIKDTIIKIKNKNPNINSLMIEKDFYISEFLSVLINKFNTLKENKVISDYSFRGGTCLAKCYMQTNRLSEDIDLTIICETDTQGKNAIERISKLFDNLEEDNLIKLVHKDEAWNQSRTYLHACIKYEESLIDIDIKYMLKDSKLFKYLNLQEKSVYNISNKLNISNDINDNLINVISLEYMVAEKIIAYEKRYWLDKRQRLARHPYDIYMIFKLKLLDNNQDTWNNIRIIYNELWKEEFYYGDYGDLTNTKYDTKFEDTYLISKGFINSKEFIDSLKILVAIECIEKENINNIISFFTNLNIK